MPGLYGITSNANISVYNTTGLYNVGNANIALQGNVTVSNTLGLYQGLGNPTIITNAQQLFQLLDESGNVQFALTNSNTTVQAFTANIGTTAGVYGDYITIPQITVGADGRVTNVQNVAINLANYSGNILSVNEIYASNIISSGNVTAIDYFLGNGAFLSGLPASSITLTGDVTGVGNTGTPVATTLSNTTVVPGTYGDDITVPQITVDAKGRVTNISNVVISGGGTGTYGNSNVAAYLPTDSTILAIQANVSAANVNIANLNANVAAANVNIATLFSNAASQQTQLDSTNANVTAANASIQTITANLGAYQIYANGAITSINANVSAANAAISTLQTQVYSNANVQAYLPINSANVAGQFFLGNAFYMTGVGAITYSNANVTAYLPKDPTITAIQSNVSILQGNIGIPTVYGNIAVVDTNWPVLQTSNASYYTYTIDSSGNSWANSASSVNNLTVLNGNVVNGNVISVTYNIGPPDYYTLRFLINRTTYPWLATTGANSLPSGGAYAGWYANAQVAMYASNATVQALSIDSIDANVGAFQVYSNTRIGTLEANVGAFETYANILFASTTSNNTEFQAAAEFPNTIAKGVPVYIKNVAGSGNTLYVAPASASSIVTSRVVGITANAVTWTAINQPTGNVLMSGLLSNVNTSSYALGDILYLGSNSGSNYLTNVAPTSPNTIIQIGTVARVGTANGAIVVNIDYTGSNYANANVAAYLPVDPTITAIQANVSAANASIQTLSANIGAYQTFANANAATQATAINTINANVSAANSAIALINANVSAANSAIATLQSNAATQAIEINTINANVAAANLAIANLAANANSYSNANVASYLPVYGGNIFVSNITGPQSNPFFPTANIVTFYNTTTIFPGNQSISNGGALFGGVTITDSVVSAPKRVDAGNLVVNYNSLFAGNLSVQNGSNVVVDVPGYFIGDGSKLTNITAGNIVGAYGNANVAAYLPTDATIQSIQANVTAANANVGAYQIWANGAISAVNANVTAANVNIADLYTKVYSNANVAAYMPLYLPTYSGDIGNLTVQGNLTVNGTTTSINYNEYVAGLLVANSTTAATTTTTGALQVKGGAGVVGNVVAGAFYSDLHLYANGQPYAGTYSNANVASYLPVYGGTINILNITGVAGQNIAIEPDGTGDILLQADTIQIGDNNQDVTVASRGTGNITLRTHFNNGAEGNITLVHGANGNIILWPNGTGTVEIKDALHATGNVYAGYYHGDGSQLINLPTQTGTYSNANVASYLPTYSGNLTNVNFVNANTVYAVDKITTLPQVSTDSIAEITPGNLFIQTGSGVVPSGSIGISEYGISASSSFGYQITTNGNVSASYFIGDGSKLSNINAGNIIGAYGNANVASYLPTDSTITSIQANVTAANSAIATLSANVGAFETYANLEFGTFSANLGAYQTYTNTAIQTLDANVGAFETYANLEFNTISANVGAYQIWANGAIGTIDANLGAFQVYSNTRIGTLEANVGAFETYANNTFSTSTYSNVNVAAYIPTDPTITAIQANVTAANAAIDTLNANVGAFETYANLEFGTISANLGAYQTWANGAIGTLDANIGAFETYANTTFATITSLQTLDANVGAFETYANLEFGSINANLGAFQTYANSTFGASTYSNANVAAYLLTNTGNISADYFLGNGYFLTGISTGGSTYGNANVAAYLPTDATIQGINANVAAANTRIQTLDANIGAYETWANGYFASTSSLNSYTLLSTFNVLDANVSAYETWANGRITTLDANIGTLFLGNISTQANLGAFQTYANATFYKSGSTITAANVISTNGYFWSNGVAYSTGGGSYGNTQVAAYLPIYGGNISAANMYATSANVTGLMFFGSSYKETVYAFGTTSGTLTVNVANGTIQTVTVNGNITINTNNFTNMGPGQSVTVVIRQDATGGRTLTSNVLFAGNAKTLTNAASAVDTLSVFYDGTSYLGALVKGYV